MQCLTYAGSTHAGWRALARLCLALAATAALTVSSAVFTISAIAHDYAAGAVHIDHPWARPTLTARTPAAVYFDIRNRGDADDRLVAASAARAAHVELHASLKDAGTGAVRMRPAKEGVLARAGRTLSMETGGYHVMLIGLDAPLKAGDAFPMTLTFEKAGDIDVTVKVEDREPQGAGHRHGH